MGFCVVEVTGEKERPRLLDILREELKDADDKDAFFPADEAACEDSEGVLDADACVYGKYSQIFHIPLDFTRPRQIRCKNGTVVLLFRSEDDLESSESD